MKSPQLYRHVSSGSLICLTVLAGCAADGSEPTPTSASIGRSEQGLVATVPRRGETPPLPQWDDAPRTPDSDDPAIWLNPKKKGQSLVVTALKEAGMQVSDMDGNLLQTIIPFNSPPLSADDPPTVGPQPDPGTAACPGSEGETFGRYNNVDVQYGFRMRDSHGKMRKIDVAIVSDRGCDRARIFEIDPDREGGPLFDITSPDAPRIFPERWSNPWTLTSNEGPTTEPNPVDDESTAYGLALYKKKHDGLFAFVTQASASTVGQIEFYDAGNGLVSYNRVREFHFDPVFELESAEHGSFTWTSCREETNEDPQFEGLAIDGANGVLYAAQETVGIWKIDLAQVSGSVVDVPQDQLIEPVTAFGQAYWAAYDEEEEEYVCEDEAPDDLEGVLTQIGDPVLAGANLEADVEGMAMYFGKKKDRGYLIASSQGDDTFHVYERQGGFTRATANAHVGVFTVEDGGETDGHDVVNVPVGAGYPNGLFVTQSGDAPDPDNTDDINGYEYDGATQFLFVGWEDIAGPLGLIVDTKGYDPRKGK